MSVYSADDIIGSVCYYLVKHDIFSIEYKRLDKIRQGFIKASGERASFSFFGKIDVIKFCDAHSNIKFDNVCERIVISDDYDYAVMKDCKKYTKKFRFLNEWNMLKQVIKAEYSIK